MFQALLQERFHSKNECFNLLLLRHGLSLAAKDRRRRQAFFAAVYAADKVRAVPPHTIQTKKHPFGCFFLFLIFQILLINLVNKFLISYSQRSLTTRVIENKFSHCFFRNFSYSLSKNRIKSLSFSNLSSTDPFGVIIPIRTSALYLTIYECQKRFSD